MTEIDWDSSPPIRNGATSLAQQADYLAEAFFELWRHGISHVFWYEVLDPGGAVFPAAGGLFFGSGAPKPSTVAFQFPFVALRGRSGRTALWGRAPTAGDVTIEREQLNGWQRLTTLRTSTGGVFYTRRRVGAHLTLRAILGPFASNSWSTS